MGFDNVAKGMGFAFCDRGNREFISEPLPSRGILLENMLLPYGLLKLKRLPLLFFSLGY